MNEIIVSKGDKITDAIKSVFLFKDVESMADEDGNAAIFAYWNKVRFINESTGESGLFLHNMDGARELKLPLKLKGWFAIYVGYMSGTQEFILSDTRRKLCVSVEKFESKDMRGQLPDLQDRILLQEVFAAAICFDNGTLSILPSMGKRACITYFKLKGMTQEEVELYNEPDEGILGKRVIYNNDGFSDFYNGCYPDANTLQQKAVDIYDKQDVEAIDWCLGTTCFLNYNSKYAGFPYRGSEKLENTLRDGDKLARVQICNFANSGKYPQQIITSRAHEIGIKANITMRMNAFYDQASYPVFNGLTYGNYEACRYVSEDNTPMDFMSYAFKEFREYVKNVIIEASELANADGVNLDFCRYPNIIGYEAIWRASYKEKYGTKPENEVTQEGIQRVQQYKADIITLFLKEIRIALTDKTISVRVPYVDYFEYGFDPQRWIDEKLIDILIPSCIGNEDFFDVRPFVEMTRNTGVKLYACITADLSGHDLTKEEEDLMKQGIQIKTDNTYLNSQQYLLRAYELYSAGCEGLYIFNNWNGKESLGLIGDKVQVAKWFTFYYPAEKVRGSVIAGNDLGR